MGAIIYKRETGVNLRRLMDARNITVKDVQEHLGLESVQSIYHWISGSSLPSLPNAYALSDLLGVSVDDLIIGNRKPITPRKFVPKTVEERRIYQYYLKMEESAA